MHTIQYNTKSQLVHCSKEMLQIQRLVPTRRRNKRTKKDLLTWRMDCLISITITQLIEEERPSLIILCCRNELQTILDPLMHASVVKVAIAKKVGSLISRRFSLLLATINTAHQKSSSSQRLFSLDHSSAPPSLLLSLQHGIQYL